MTMKNRSAPWVLAAVFSTNLGVGLIFGFEPPLIAIVLNRAGSDAFVIGTVIAISLVAVTLAGPFYPYWIGRLGLKRSVLSGIAVGVLILVAMPYWNSIPAWIALRILTGCALGLSWVASEIWMNTVSGAASRGTVMGIYGTVFSTGTVAGPVLLEITGTRGPEPFLLGALCLAVTLLPLLLLRQAAESSAARVPPPPQSLRMLFGLARAAPVIMLAAAVAGLVESADLSLLPLFGLRAGLDERAALFLVTAFLAGNMVLQLPIGMLADRYGRRRLLGICALTSGVGPLLLPRALESPALLWPLLFLWGGTLYAFYSQGIALLGEEFGHDRLAGANTLFVMIYCIGGVLGPSIGGIALDAWPRMGLPLLLSVPAFGLLAALVLAPRRVGATA